MLASQVLLLFLLWLLPCSLFSLGLWLPQPRGSQGSPRWELRHKKGHLGQAEAAGRQEASAVAQGERRLTYSWGEGLNRRVRVQCGGWEEIRIGWLWGRGHSQSWRLEQEVVLQQFSSLFLPPTHKPQGLLDQALALSENLRPASSPASGACSLLTLLLFKVEL